MANDKNYTFIIHEIKNEVTLLQSALQLMNKNHLETNHYEEWDMIHSTFSDLSELFHNVTDVKNFLEIQMTTQTIDSFLSSFEACVRQLCSNAEISAPVFEHRASNSHLQMYKTLHDGNTTLANSNCSHCNNTSSTSVAINAPLLERALLNLVQNAIDAMKNSVSKTLLVHTCCDKYQFCISITDSGMGMNKEILDLMYTPSFTTKGNGLGLGLCIVKEIINAHHGTLLCESVLDKGTTFTVVLPVKNN